MSHHYAVVIPRWWWVVSLTVGSDKNTCFRQVGTRKLPLGITLLTLDIFELSLKLLSLISIIPVLYWYCNHPAFTTPHFSFTLPVHWYVALCCYCCCFLWSIGLGFLFTLLYFTTGVVSVHRHDDDMMMMMTEFYCGWMMVLMDSLLFRFSLGSGWTRGSWYWMIRHISHRVRTWEHEGLRSMDSKFAKFLEQKSFVGGAVR
jgi:hypothetical protein